MRPNAHDKSEASSRRASQVSQREPGALMQRPGLDAVQALHEPDRPEMTRAAMNSAKDAER